MYTLQLFSIGYTREAHRHFVSKVAENNFFKKYALNSAAITCERVFNPKAREFSVNIYEIPNYEQASYLIATHKEKFYYYYITDYNVINGVTVVYKVEEDIYHTYFNNRGDYFNFSGRLLRSNTNSDIVYNPTIKPAFTTVEDFVSKTEIPDTNYNFRGVVVISLQNHGINTLVTDSYPDIFTARSALKEILDSGTLTYHVTGGTSTSETFKVINTYIIPSVIVTSDNTIPVTYWSGENGKNLFYALGRTVYTKFNIKEIKNKSAYVGTALKRIKLPKNEKSDFIDIEIQFVSTPNPDLIIIINSINTLSIIDDFSCTIGLSEFSQYLATNKMGIALSGISSVVGVGASVVSGNPLAAVAGTLSGLQSVNEIYKASMAPDTVHEGNGNVAITFALYPHEDGSKSRGIGIFICKGEKQIQLDNYFVAFGGECSGKYQTIADIIATDGDKSVYKNSGFFYQFSYIESGNDGTLGGSAYMNKIADMFTNGIRIYYIQE